MTSHTSVENLSGAKKIIEWFGCWPSFHDSEVINIELNRSGISQLKIHYFCATGEIGKNGYYVTGKHAIVSFILEDIQQLELTGFNQQNVLSAICIAPVESNYEITLGDCYGVSGRILASKLSFDLQPGMPDKSVYAETV